MGPSGEILEADLKNVSDGQLYEEIERRLQEGKYNTDYILKLCSAMNAASKGDYPQKG